MVQQKGCGTHPIIVDTGREESREIGQSKIDPQAHVPLDLYFQPDTTSYLLLSLNNPTYHESND